jgi:hypothetical protein
MIVATYSSLRVTMTLALRVFHQHDVTTCLASNCEPYNKVNVTLHRSENVCLLIPLSFIPFVRFNMLFLFSV